LLKSPGAYAALSAKYPKVPPVSIVGTNELCCQPILVTIG
jgi:hypothetical protein